MTELLWRDDEWWVRTRTIPGHPGQTFDNELSRFIEATTPIAQDSQHGVIERAVEEFESRADRADYAADGSSSGWFVGNAAGLREAAQYLRELQEGK